jgi:hypothetical protein
MVAFTDHWTRAAKNQAHNALQPYLVELKRTYRDARLSWWEVFLGLYADSQDVSVLCSRASSISSPLTSTQAIPVNIIRPIVDTAEAKIAGATRPRPYFKAVGASWSQKRKCQRLQKFMDGIIDETKAYRVGAQMVRDAAIFGTGACKIFVRAGKIHVERVLVSEIVVDENLAFDCAPRELTHSKEVSKSALLRDPAFAKYRAQIEALTPTNAGLTSWSDTVEVDETWALKDGNTPGKHVITINGATLLDEPYDRTYFPIVFFRWSEPITGFYGQGLAHQLMGLQIEITRWFRSISTNLHLLANPRVITYEGSDVNPHHLTNAWGTVLKAKSPALKPELWTSQVMPPEVYNWFERMYQKGFELAGFSQQSVFAKKEPGVESGKAMRELSDIQADRMAPKSVAYENVYIDMARVFIDCAEELFKKDPSFSTVFQGTGSAERLKYADVRLEENEYTIQLFATSFLSRTPSAAYDDIKDMMQVELIDASEARSLMNFPDLQRVFDLENSERDNVERMIELMLDDGLAFDPDPYGGLDGLEREKKVFKEAYKRAQVDQVAEERVDLLRKYLDGLTALIDEAKAAEAALAAPPQQIP